MVFAAVAYVLGIICLLLYVLTGGVIIFVGYNLKTLYNEYMVSLPPIYIHVAYGLIAVGVLIIFLTILVTNLYFINGIIILVMEITVGFSGRSLKNKTLRYLENILLKIIQEYNIKEEVTHLWDTIQEKFVCCGINSPSDWITNSTNNFIPMSCCTTPSGSLGNVSCTLNSTTLHQEGCLDTFGDYVRHHAVYVEAVGIVFAVVLILSSVFCYCAFRG